MTRPQVIVRAATTEDAPALLELWQQVLAQSGPAGRTSEAPTVESVRSRLEALHVDPQRRLLVGVDGSAVVGLAHVVREPLTPLHDEASVRVSYFHVDEAHRRRGVGTALVTAAAAFGEQVGAGHVVADCNPAARETNRFFARLGFGQLLVQRTVPLAVLRRRLLPEPAAEAVAVRRASRRARVRARHKVAVVGRRGSPFRFTPV